ncbi:MAG: efflux RND transporter periplasmic adaptor subunit, partial [Proteobacteria bacterium]
MTSKNLGRDIKKKVVTLIVLTLAFCGLYLTWSYYTESPWTRDGKIRADVIALASDVSGRATEVLVKDNEGVDANQILFRVDQERLKIALARTEALLASAEQTRNTAKKEADRYGSLSGVVSEEIRLQRKTTSATAESTYQQAIADRDLARLNLERSEVRAPAKGVVTNFNLRVGAYVTAGVPVTAFVSTDTFYVSGYFEETKLQKIQVGAPATITLMGDSRIMKAAVESVSSGIEDRERTTAAGSLL